VTRRDAGEAEDRSPLPLRATGIVLGLWISILVVAAFVVVPALFSVCTLPG